MKLFNLLFVLILSTQPAHAANRIKQAVLDVGKIETIEIAPGLISLIEFPENVTEVSTGAPQLYRTQVSPIHQTEVLLQLQSPSPFVTNMIVRTTKRILVFELKPNLKNHQDVLVIRDTKGSLHEDDKYTDLRERRLKAEREQHL